MRQSRGVRYTPYAADVVEIKEIAKIFPKNETTKIAQLGDGLSRIKQRVKKREIVAQGAVATAKRVSGIVSR